MKKITLLLSMLLLSLLVHAEPCLEVVAARDFVNPNPLLIYENNFDNAASLDDWLIEGPGNISIENGMLRIESNYAAVTQAFMEANPGSSDQEIRDHVEGLMVADLGQQFVNDNSYLNGSFKDAHFVCWNTKIQTPENYIIEMSFKSIADYRLHMIMFSHLGFNDEDVFDSGLKERYGISNQYTKSDLKGYRISYYHPDRKPLI